MLKGLNAQTPEAGCMVNSWLCFVVSSKLLNLSFSQFPPVNNGCNSAYQIGLL